jgi:hypothetical protein
VLACPEPARDRRACARTIVLLLVQPIELLVTEPDAPTGLQQTKPRITEPPALRGEFTDDAKRVRPLRLVEGVRLGFELITYIRRRKTDAGRLRLL